MGWTPLVGGNGESVKGKKQRKKQGERKGKKETIEELKLSSNMYIHIKI